MTTRPHILSISVPIHVLKHCISWNYVLELVGMVRVEPFQFSAVAEIFGVWCLPSQARHRESEEVSWVD